MAERKQSPAHGLGYGAVERRGPEIRWRSQRRGCNPREPAPTEDLLAPWSDQVCQWLTGDRLQLTRVQGLLAARNFPVSYASLQRFIQCRNWRRRNPATARIEDTAPGEVAELGFVNADGDLTRNRRW